MAAACRWKLTGGSWRRDDAVCVRAVMAQIIKPVSSRPNRTEALSGYDIPGKTPKYVASCMRMPFPWPMGDIGAFDPGV